MARTLAFTRRCWTSRRCRLTRPITWKHPICIALCSKERWSSAATTTWRRCRSSLCRWGWRASWSPSWSSSPERRGGRRREHPIHEGVLYGTVPAIQPGVRGLRQDIQCHAPGIEATKDVLAAMLGGACQEVAAGKHEALYQVGEISRVPEKIL